MFGGGAAPPICKTSNRMAKRYFLLSLAKICLLEAGKKMSGGVGGAQPPHLQNIQQDENMSLLAELCLREHVVSFPSQRC